MRLPGTWDPAGYISSDSILLFCFTQSLWDRNTFLCSVCKSTSVFIQQLVPAKLFFQAVIFNCTWIFHLMYHCSPQNIVQKPNSHWPDPLLGQNVVQNIKSARADQIGGVWNEKRLCKDFILGERSLMDDGVLLNNAIYVWSFLALQPWGLWRCCGMVMFNKSTHPLTGYSLSFWVTESYIMCLAPLPFILEPSILKMCHQHFSFQSMTHQLIILNGIIPYNEPQQTHHFHV